MRSGVGLLVSELDARGLRGRKLTVATTEQAITAHASILEAIVAKRLTHGGDDVLAGSVASSGRRPIGRNGGWGVQSINGGDSTLFEAAILAHYGAITSKKRNVAQRKVVVRS